MYQSLREIEHSHLIAFWSKNELIIFHLNMKIYYHSLVKSDNFLYIFSTMFEFISFWTSL